MHTTNFSALSRFWFGPPLVLFLTLGCLATTACQRNTAPSRNVASPTAHAASTRSIPDNSVSTRSTLSNTPSSPRNTVLFLGDSLTAGFRLAPSEAYPALIAEHWKKQGLSWQSRNAGVSGDTTAGVIRRLDWVLTEDVHTVFLAIGANDGLRGQSLAHIEKNLRTIISHIRKKGIAVIVAGIKLPRNYGKSYYEQFEQMYPRLAQHFQVPLLPFLLEGVAAVKELNLSDGIHPNTQGHQIIARNVLRFFTQQKLFITSIPATSKGTP